MTETIEQPARVRIPCPEPGVYENVPAKEYFAWDACNKSSLDHLESHSPMHCRYFRDNPPEDSAALLVGSAFHSMVLEPAKFETEFAIEPEFGDCRTKENKARRDAWRAANADKRWLTAVQAEQVGAWRDALMRHENARRFIEDEGANEVSIVWDDVATGVRCKARIDMVRPGWESLGDLKTTADASPNEFMRSIAVYGYDRQSAWYLDGAKGSGLGAKYGVEFKHFPFFCVEKPAPYGVALYRPMKDMVELGQEQNTKLLLKYSTCLDANNWPGYSPGFEDISLPRWRARQIIEAR